MVGMDRVVRMGERLCYGAQRGALCTAVRGSVRQLVHLGLIGVALLSGLLFAWAEAAAAARELAERSAWLDASARRDERRVAALGACLAVQQDGELLGRCLAAWARAAARECSGRRLGGLEGQLAQHARLIGKLQDLLAVQEERSAPSGRVLRLVEEIESRSLGKEPPSGTVRPQAPALGVGGPGRSCGRSAQVPPRCSATASAAGALLELCGEFCAALCGGACEGEAASRAAWPYAAVRRRPA